MWLYPISTVTYILSLNKIWFCIILPGSGTGSAWIGIHFKSWIRIRINLKGWIRIRINLKGWIRIRLKSMQIRNTAYRCVKLFNRHKWMKISNKIHTMPVKEIFRRLMTLNDLEKLAGYRLLWHISLVQFILQKATELYLPFSCIIFSKMWLKYTLMLSAVFQLPVTTCIVFKNVDVNPNTGTYSIYYHIWNNIQFFIHENLHPYSKQDIPIRYTTRYSVLSITTAMNGKAQNF
jgi:hypothetical protein